MVRSRVSHEHPTEKHQKKSFKTNTVLNGVSLDVAKGETLVLFGPLGGRQDRALCV